MAAPLALRAAPSDLCVHICMWAFVSTSDASKVVGSGLFSICFGSVVRFVDSIHCFESLARFLVSMLCFDSLIRCMNSIPCLHPFIRCMDSIHSFDSWIRFLDAVHGLHSLVRIMIRGFDPLIRFMASIHHSIHGLDSLIVFVDSIYWFDLLILFVGRTKSAETLFVSPLQTITCARSAPRLKRNREQCKTCFFPFLSFAIFVYYSFVFSSFFLLLSFLFSCLFSPLFFFFFIFLFCSLLFIFFLLFLFTSMTLFIRPEWQSHVPGPCRASVAPPVTSCAFVAETIFPGKLEGLFFRGGTQHPDFNRGFY